MVVDEITKEIQGGKYHGTCFLLMIVLVGENRKEINQRLVWGLVLGRKGIKD